MEVHRSATEPWKVTLVDTGEGTMTGGRLKRVLRYVEDEDFCFTYGDGLSDVDITAAIAFHREQGTTATVTAVQPAGRFGAIDVDGERVSGFEEKPRGDRAWTNGGFFVLSPGVVAIPGRWRRLVWEQRADARAGRATASCRPFSHEGFWQPMDTLRDRRELETVDSARPVADVGLSAHEPPMADAGS